MKSRVIILDVVGLSLAHFDHPEKIPNLSGLLNNGKLYQMKPVFPAVTMPVQASITTGTHPADHGIIANGFYSRDNYQVSFWEQAASLVQQERTWERLHKKDPGIKTALLFLQNSLYSESDIVVTPKPMHTHDGLVQWCYSKPVGFYEELAENIGDFELMHYWGPMASIGSSAWIAQSAVETIDRFRPDYLYTYLPHLDYCMQKFGPESAEATEGLQAIDHEVGQIIKGVEDLKLLDETIFVVFSEYAFYGVSGAIPINLFLREHGLLKVRSIQGREYVDFELSPAFAMVDHQVAHIYVKEGFEKQVADIIEKIDGIDMLLDSTGKEKYKVNHQRSGELVAVSARDRWFSYYWWEGQDKEPDFASHVDIHRKPGYDPLELVLEPGTRRISQDITKIKGSHGYPPNKSTDFVPLIISGDVQQPTLQGDSVDMVNLSGILEDLLLEDNETL